MIFSDAKTDINGFKLDLVLVRTCVWLVRAKKSQKSKKNFSRFLDLQGGETPQLRGLISRARGGNSKIATMTQKVLIQDPDRYPI